MIVSPRPPFYHRRELLSTKLASKNRNLRYTPVSSRGSNASRPVVTIKEPKVALTLPRRPSKTLRRAGQLSKRSAFHADTSSLHLVTQTPISFISKLEKAFVVSVCGDSHSGLMCCEGTRAAGVTPTAHTCSRVSAVTAWDGCLILVPISCRATLSFPAARYTDSTCLYSSWWRSGGDGVEVVARRPLSEAPTLSLPAGPGGGLIQISTAESDVALLTLGSCYRHPRPAASSTTTPCLQRRVHASPRQEDVTLPLSGGKQSDRRPMNC
ncbi:hypothetical protein E2C01_069816 [Portunus trituberculatus]|uniref:Uncharacterized protein n=1 Tax=Portunus trituberculatus TaxID=210409 RepID=A0A5B7I0J6_PORTR|nr:hypothetical protein [Portunus trituberculatus]